MGVHVATLRPGNPTIPEFKTMSGKHLGSGLVLCEPPTKNKACTLELSEKLLEMAAFHNYPFAA